MRSKRVILYAAIALIAAGSVFGLALWAARVDSRPFDDGVAVTKLAPVDDWTLPEGAVFVSAKDGKEGTIVLVLDYNGQTVGVTSPRLIDDDDVQAGMAFQMETLRRREDGAGVVGPESGWTPVRVRHEWRDESGMIGEGFASRSVRAIASVRRDSRLNVHIWNARGNAAQDIMMSAASGAERRQGLRFVEAWRVPECNDETDLKAKWEAFVVRTRDQQ